MANQTDTNLVELNTLLEQADKYEEKAFYTLKNGGDMEFYPYFSRTKIQEVIQEFQTYLASEDKKDQKFMEIITKDEFTTILFWYFLAIKKFTHFGEQMKKIKKVSSLAPYYNAMLETGILEEIVNDVFLYEELNKISDMFAQASATGSAVVDFMSRFEEERYKAVEKFNKQFDIKPLHLQSDDDAQA